MSMGKLLMIVGAAALLLGLVLNFAPGLLGWFGKLPGDIRIQDQHKSIFIPITSMIVVSILLTIILNLFFRK